MGSEENIAPVRGEQDPHTQPPHPGEKETCHAQQSYLSLKEFEKAYYRRVPRCEEAGDGRDAPSIRINALQHGISDIMTRDADKNEKRANRAVQHDFWVGCIYPHLMAIRSQFPPKQNPNMWITGHSLGAATATLFTASIVWRLCAAGHNSTVPHIFLDHFNLCGTYTFGTPRTGDTSYRNALEKLMHENSIEKMLKYMSIEREVTVDTDDDEPTRTSFEQYNNICNILDDGSVRNLVESDLIEESVGLIIEKIRSQDAKKTMDKYSEIKRLVRTARKMKAVASEEDAASVIDDIKEVIFDWHGKPAVAGNRNPRAQSPTKAENDIPKYDDLVKNSNLDINLPFPDPPKRKKQDRPYQFYRVINANDVVCSVPGGPLKNLGESLRRRKTRPLATQGTRENNRQAGQTLTDFQHLGLPVLLSFRGGPLRWKERDYGDYIRNMFREVTHSLPDLFSEDTTTFGARLMIVLTVLTGGGIGFIKDHAPRFGTFLACTLYVLMLNLCSEYLINLNMARPRTGESLPPA
ncbi:hypothetical protein DFS34DRAFT_406956 [Phlyctochytrium arcticum]|nr:hypothetical protein DFS34DRAFT_406956 [Phlyctochytrium arcticum]